LDDFLSASQPLLEVKDLKTHFFTQEGVVHAVDGIDLAVHRGQILGLVGESGCGKTVAGLSILQLVEPPGRIVDGYIGFDGRSLVDLPESQMDDLRGRHISMIFQQPLSSLNPVFTIGDQVSEVFRVHHRVRKAEAERRAVALLRQVGIPDPERRFKSYPHEISGGQAQRVMIAMALALNPELLIADEPTTALDVTIQAQILDLIRQMIRERNTGVILITHDLGVVAETANRVAVMYAGRIVEEADVGPIFAAPLHPYTQGLAESLPVLGAVKERLKVIPGIVPDPMDRHPGCRFAPRCEARARFGLEICVQQEPELAEVKHRQRVRCWLYLDHGGHKAPMRASVSGPE
jgi:oligopeptide/dipeptide ABC transporter ATP-binding protein